ncbi:MAG: VapC toxin family PIN domain ribonuclease [Candidatus Eisenbacteria bacterium]|nr:VapC toxin family PIN domain ribonuclease [Candidatus Eisenbacteria bacterium]
MRALDTGILMCAVNRYVPGHARAAAVVETLANGEKPWALPVSVVHEFMRLVTHPHATARSLDPADAFGWIDQLLGSSTARLLTPGAAHAAVIRDVLGLVSIERGLPDGFQTAVLCREHDVRELLSADPGMRRYAFLAVRDPLHGAPWSPDQPPARRYRKLSPRRPVGVRGAVTERRST